MDTPEIMRVETASSEETEQLASRIGAALKGGEVIELVSDVGGGKTTFTRGLVRGAGSDDRVGSPTFTINREYTCPNFVISHFDFYRLSEAGVVGEELAETIGDPRIVTVIEWGETVWGVLPASRLVIEIEQTDYDGRALVFKYDSSLSYLLEGVSSW